MDRDRPGGFADVRDALTRIHQLIAYLFGTRSQLYHYLASGFSEVAFALNSMLALFAECHYECWQANHGVETHARQLTAIELDLRRCTERIDDLVHMIQDLQEQIERQIEEPPQPSANDEGHPWRS